MRLGFDLDGTVADLKSALALEARRLFPDIDPSALPSSAPESLAQASEGADEPSAAPGPGAPLSMHALSSRQQGQIWKAVCDRENFWETLDEIEPGSLARLYRLVQDRCWELIFLTSRPDTRGDSVQTQSHRWLSAKGYLTPSVFVVHGSRGKIAASLALDIVVDDRPENCLDVAVDSSARPILVWRGDKRQTPGSTGQLGIGSVQSIGECLDVLESLDRARTDQGGLVDRLKRLLGLKPQAARVNQPAKPARTTPGPHDRATGIH